MGQRTKGQMWCDFCGGPVLATKTTHRIRNAAAVVASLPTAGISLAGARVEGYRCPNCGQSVRHATDADFERIAQTHAPRNIPMEAPPEPSARPELPTTPPAPRSPDGRKSELRLKVDSRPEKEFKTSLAGLLQTFAPGRADIPRTREIVAAELRSAGLGIREPLQSARGAVTVYDAWPEMEAVGERSGLGLGHRSVTGPATRKTAQRAPAELSLAEEIQKLAALHAAGALTDAEFSAAKSRLLEP